MTSDTGESPLLTNLDQGTPERGRGQAVGPESRRPAARSPGRRRAGGGGLDRGGGKTDLTDVKTAISTKGQIVLPAEIRQQDEIEPGQMFEIERIDRGEYRLVRLSPPRNQGLLIWLLACPEKGFFVPIEPE